MPLPKVASVFSSLAGWELTGKDGVRRHGLEFSECDISKGAADG